MLAIIKQSSLFFLKSYLRYDYNSVTCVQTSVCSHNLYVDTYPVTPGILHKAYDKSSCLQTRSKPLLPLNQSPSTFGLSWIHISASSCDPKRCRLLVAIENVIETLVIYNSVSGGWQSIRATIVSIHQELKYNWMKILFDLYNRKEKKKIKH